MGVFRIIFMLMLACLLWLVPSAMGGQESEAATDAAQAGRRLAQRVVVLIGPGQPLRVAVENRSSLPAGELARARATFFGEMESHGSIFITGDATPAASITLTASENPRGYLLVADVRRLVPSAREGGVPIPAEGPVPSTGDRAVRRDVLMVAFDRPPAVAAPAAPRFTLDARLLVTQPTPILDFALLSAAAPGGALLVLEPERLALYRMRGETWTLAQEVPLRPPASPMRDLRGRLVVREGYFSVFLPGRECSGAIEPRLELVCERGEGWWELAAVGNQTAGGVLVEGRNHFRGLDWWQPTGVAERRPEFFSVAGFRWRETPLWIYAGADGIARLYGPGNRLFASLPDWGSQVAGVESGCGGGWQVLASRPTDWTAPDAVQAYEFDAPPGAPLRAREASAAVEFAGPVLSLAAAEDNRAAFAVVRNSGTGLNEAYALTISCSR